MTVADTIIGLVVDSLPGAYLWEETGSTPPVGDLVVFDGIVPDTPPHRYVVVYVDDGTRRAENVAHESTGATFRWQTTSVAPDRPTTAWLSGKVKDGLLDVSPTVDGWSTGLIQHTFSQLPQRDEQVLERAVLFAVDQFSLLAERLVPAES